MTTNTLGQVLKGFGIVDDDTLEYALKISKTSGSRLGETLQALGFVTDLEIAQAIAQQAGVSFSELNEPSAPEVLRLRKGARVMCVKNNFEEGYVNGTLGVVVSCAPDSDPVIRTGASPDHPEGRLITIERANWQIADDGKILAELDQYPLRLAWAITVHKSQGMSLDAVEVDLSKAFEAGMGYVALSRVRTLAGLSILGFSENALKVNGEVLEFDRHLRELLDLNLQPRKLRRR